MTASGIRILADVVDIRQDKPRKSDAFLVDTNVLYWLSYSRAATGDQPPMFYQATEYPNYVSKAASAESKLFLSALSFAELAHLIEQTEFDIFRRSHPDMKLKSFRHATTLRAAVVDEISAAWEIVRSLIEPVETSLDESALADLVKALPIHAMDGYDLLIARAAADSSLHNILTDDGDFAVLPGIRLFTANRQIVNAARDQGRLLTR